MRKVWKDVNEIAHVQDIELEAWRIIEDQLKSFTRKMVDTAEEHAILEKMIEESKPTIITYGDENAFKGLHYLLATPFRYPPLKKGSRFGSRSERNLFYSSLEIETAMSEKAFHRLGFLIASDGNVGNKTVNYTAFKTKIKTKKGLNLSLMPFALYQNEISCPISYIKSQELGQCMREAGVEAFVSHSARCKNRGKNVNVFTPKAIDIEQSIEKTFQSFTCFSTKSTVEFYSNLSFIKSPMIFGTKDFYVNGTFPIMLE